MGYSLWGLKELDTTEHCFCFGSATSFFLELLVIAPCSFSVACESEIEVAQLGSTLCDPMDTRLLCPWNFPGKNTRVGCHVLLRGIFPTQGLNPCLLQLLYWQADSLPLSHLGSLLTSITSPISNLLFYCPRSSNLRTQSSIHSLLLHECSSLN